jgi:hypothetical protein
LVREVVPEPLDGVLNEAAAPAIAGVNAGAMPADGGGNLAGGERRILFEDAAMERCCGFPSLLLASGRWWCCGDAG